MKKRMIYVFLVSICFISCNNENKNKLSTNELDLDIPTQKVDLNSYVNSVEQIQLQEEEGYILGRIVKMDRIDDQIYLIDKPSRGSNVSTIYKYDMQGNPVAKFMNQGGGPNEYFEIIDFDINVHKKEINLLCLPPKLITLDFDFNLIKEQMLEKPYTQLASSNNTLFLYSYYASCLDNLSDGVINTVMTFNPPAKGIIYTPNSGDFSFFRADNDVYFQPYLGDELFYISNDSISEFKKMNYEYKTEAEEFYRNTDIEDISFENSLKYKLPKVQYMFTNAGGLKIAYIWGIEYKLYCFNNKGNDEIFSNGSLYGSISPVNRSNYLLASTNVEEYPFNKQLPEAYENIEFKNRFIKDSLLMASNQNPIIILYNLH